MLDSTTFIMRDLRFLSHNTDCVRAAACDFMCPEGTAHCKVSLRRNSCVGSFLRRIDMRKKREVLVPARDAQSVASAQVGGCSYNG